MTTQPVTPTTSGVSASSVPPPCTRRGITPLGRTRLPESPLVVPAKRARKLSPDPDTASVDAEDHWVESQQTDQTVLQDRRLALAALGNLGRVLHLRTPTPTRLGSQTAHTAAARQPVRRRDSNESTQPWSNMSGATLVMSGTPACMDCRELYGISTHCTGECSECHCSLCTTTSRRADSTRGDGVASADAEPLPQPGPPPARDPAVLTCGRCSWCDNKATHICGKCGHHVCHGCLEAICMESCRCLGRCARSHLEARLWRCLARRGGTAAEAAQRWHRFQEAEAPEALLQEYLESYNLGTPAQPVVRRQQRRWLHILSKAQLAVAPNAPPEVRQEQSILAAPNSGSPPLGPPSPEDPSSDDGDDESGPFDIVHAKSSRQQRNASGSERDIQEELIILRSSGSRGSGSHKMLRIHTASVECIPGNGSADYGEPRRSDYVL